MTAAIICGVLGIAPVEATTPDGEEDLLLERLRGLPPALDGRSQGRQPRRGDHRGPRCTVMWRPRCSQSDGPPLAGAAPVPRSRPRRSR